MNQQIIDPDLGLNNVYNAGISTGEPHFKMEKYTNITGIQIVGSFRIEMLNDTVLLLKNLVQFW